MKLEAAQRLTAKVPFDLTEINALWHSTVTHIFRVPHSWVLIAKATPMPLGTGFYLHIAAGEAHAMSVTTHNAMLKLTFSFSFNAHGFKVEQVDRYLVFPAPPGSHLAFERVKLPIMRAVTVNGEDPQEMERASESFVKTILLKYVKKAEEVFKQHHPV